MACVIMEMVVVVRKCYYAQHVYAEREYWQTQAEDKDELLDRIEILNANLDRLRTKYDTNECKCHNNSNGDKAADDTPNSDTAATARVMCNHNRML